MSDYILLQPFKYPRYVSLDERGETLGAGWLKLAKDNLHRSGLLYRVSGFESAHSYLVLTRWALVEASIAFEQLGDLVSANQARKLLKKVRQMIRLRAVSAV
jgi:hypothetical protein